MKKLYTLALAAAVALSASAEKVHKMYRTDIAPVGAREAYTVDIDNAKRVGDVALMRKAPAKVAAAADYTGEYIWKYYCPLGQTGSNESGMIAISEINQEGIEGALLIEGVDSDIPMVAWYEEDGTLTIEQMNLGSLELNDGTTVDVYSVPLGLAADESMQYTEKSSFALDANGNLTMSEMEGFGLAAVTPADGKILGWFNMCFFNEFERYNEADYWTNGDGKAQFTDGILASVFQGAKYETVEVDAQQSVQNPTEYRLLNPYIHNFDGFESSPALYFDIADPNCVIFPFQSTGVTAGNNMGVCCIISISALYPTIEEFLASNDAALNATYDPATRTINIVENALGVVWPQSTNPQIDPDGVYSYQNAKPSKIVLPEFSAVENVTVSETGAVEYFNLQGIRVANPEHGVYIRRHGNKATKILVP